jgi:Cu(I)/Ag(I) efflux system membrane fusion protein
MNEERRNPMPPGGESRTPAAAHAADAPAARPPAHDPPPPGAGFMNGLRWALFAGLLLLAAVSITSWLLSRRATTSSAAQAKKAAYHCPMHPSYTSDRPGECPICGMNLEPIPDSAHGASPADGDVPGLAGVHITPERVQLIGVRTARVESRTLGSRLDLVGLVAPDETQLRRVQLRAAGWVQELFVSRTGERVAAGQPLLAIYSPELYQSEQEYLIELGARDSMSAMSHEGGARSAARERLRLLGVPPEEIARLERERTASTRLVLTAPFAGTVLERGVVEGQYVGADTPLFSLADLTRVWVLADLYEMDFGRARPGDPARFTADALPGRAFEGRVDFIYPTVSSETRTVKLRIALENPGGELRPGMYGRVLVTAGGAPSLAIPAEAVVNAGEHDYVFLARAGGHFEPRRVTVGVQDGDWSQILEGLAAGDTVVASASFLIDSESRLKAAIAGMGKASSGSPAAPEPQAPGGHKH